MELIYTGQNELRRAVNGIAALAFAVYIIGASALLYATRTGHPSADIKTGISKPTQLEQVLIDYGKSKF